MIAEGKHTAKLSDAGFTFSNSGSVMLNLRFKTEKDEYASWGGSFATEKSRDFVMKTMLQCGFTADDITEGMLASGSLMDYLDRDKLFEIVVEYETSQNGKTYATVRYINDQNKFSYAPANDVVKTLAGFNLKSEFNRLRGAATNPNPTGEVKRTTESFDFNKTSLDEIPF